MQILIVDDHPLFRDALKTALQTGMPDATVEEAGTFDGAAAILERQSGCDLVLLDLRMPGVQGLSGLMYLRAQHPGLPVAIVSAHEDNDVMRRALEMGACGFIPKSSDAEMIVSAVKTMAEGDVWMPAHYAERQAGDGTTDDLARRLATLSAQQIRVLMMLRAGLLNKQIAYELGVSEATIKSHVSAILQKLGVSSRTQAVIMASRIDGLPDATVSH